jgi:DNA-binding MarR family transcriptional regulator
VPRPLTDRQKQVLSYVADNPFCAIVSLQERLGFKSHSTVRDHVIRLKAKGYVTWCEHRHRTLQATTEGRKALREETAHAQR